MSDVLSFRRSHGVLAREQLLDALRAFGNDDFSVRLPSDGGGADEALIQAFNRAAEANERCVRQARELETRMRSLEQARAALEDKAEQLTISSRYKSEFLANMSHELRTPLNSMLILSKLLSDNNENNLTDKQVDYAQTIYAAGTDLLSLIDDILDLAKIESGTVILNVEPESLASLRDQVLRTFGPQARNKGLAFQVEMAPGLPETLRTDGKCLEQILKNLLSNAFKFTRQGRVLLHVAPVTLRSLPGEPPREWIAFTVSDTGIGIPEGKLRLIFEAFQQADSSTSREFGGTGLGLSICRELSHLLEGQLRVESVLGQGSRFTLYLPLSLEGRHLDTSGPLKARDTLPDESDEAAPDLDMPPGSQAERRRLGGAKETYYGRKSRRSDEGMVLVANRDNRLADVFQGLVRGGGCQGVVATDVSRLHMLTQELLPDALILGMDFAVEGAWSLLRTLCQEQAGRRIPISLVMAGREGMASLELLPTLGWPGQESAGSGPYSWLGGRPAQLLRLPAEWAASGRGWDYPHVLSLVDCASEDELLSQLAQGGWDGVLFEREPKDMEGMLLRLMSAPLETPLLIGLPGMDGKAGEVGVLRHQQRLEELLDDTARFLERGIASLPLARPEGISRRRRASADLVGRKVLIVDDDIRNIYALTGALEQQGMSVLYAENGRDGLDILRRQPGVDVVLMDIMMPEMDGYDVIRLIRDMDAFRDLPIIAVTARAMQEDRERCLQAGASDYIAKPVNVEHLLALMRVWLLEAE